MDELVRHMPWARSATEREALLTREWLVTNGLGGYAAGTVAGQKLVWSGHPVRAWTASPSSRRVSQVAASAERVSRQPRIGVSA